MYSYVFSLFLLVFSNAGCTESVAAEHIYRPAECGEKISVLPQKVKAQLSQKGKQPSLISKEAKPRSPHKVKKLTLNPKAQGGVQTKININTASAKELESLPGIGPALAKRIVNYRIKRKFKRLRDIRRVKGIGRAKYKKLKELISLK